MECCRYPSMSKDNPTEMQHWHQMAITLYFQEKLKIEEIGKRLGKHRNTVSRFLETVPGFSDEKIKRKIETGKKRKEYQRNWDRTQRKRPSAEDSFVEGAWLKRQHNIDVMVLSSERH